jgi:JmjC domain
MEQPASHAGRLELRRRVDEALTKLDRAGGLRAPCHLPGLFADLVRGFDCDAFEARIFAEGRIAPGRTEGPYGGVWYQGDTSYHAWFDDDASRVHTRRATPLSFLSTTRLPLPRWALELQQELLTRLYEDSDFGWSAEIFFSREGQASMGAHADNDDVFTVQLHGEKRWRVDPVSLNRLEVLIKDGALSRDGPQSAWHFAAGRPADLVEPQLFHLRPGDFLATPAFALHEVSATGAAHSLSFNVSICREQTWEAWQQGRSGPG